MEKNIVKNTIELDIQETDQKGKGRYFVSKFLEAGLAHYKELGDILIKKETIDKFIHTLVGCPVIIEHKDVTDKNVDELRVGVISKVWYNEFDGWYYCEGVITDNEAIDLIKNQGWSVSCAYSFKADDTQKTYHGKDIDMEFVDGEFLHLAIVPDPRYEDAEIVVNSKDKTEDKKELQEKEDNKEVKNNEDKENIIMQVLNELKNFILGVVNNEEKEDEMAKVKNEDKRKLIDEVGGMLKDKVDEELWRTIIGKLEKVAYEPSEDDKADNEEEKDEKEAKNKCKNEEDKEEKEEKEEKDEEKAENKCKNEDEEEDKKEVKNSMKDTIMGGNSQAKEEKLYISRKERLEIGNKY